MSTEIVVPDYLKEMMDPNSAASMISSGGSSVPRISLKGQKFRFIKDGEEVAATADPIQVVILGVQPENGMCKTFYADGYDPNSSDPPDCSSMDGIRPDNWVNSPQASTCATCPKNKWGSAKSMSGGKAKACRDSKRLFIINPKNGIEDADGYILNVTVASLKALTEYGKHLVSNGMPFEAAVTNISMVDGSDFPQLEFSFAGALKEEHGMLAIARAKKHEWVDAIEYKPEEDDVVVEEVVQVTGTTQETTAAAEQAAEGTVVESTAEVVEQKPAANTGAESVDDILDGW